MENSGIAFVIMQIGNTELDKVYSDIYVPAILAAKLEPKRIDKDNEGKLLKKEIIEFIEKAEIIIADLTNERPNCYLEIGYTMGLDKYKNLIFTAKDDHLPDSPYYKKDGPKIHFDLRGYEILFWNSNEMDEFKVKLTEKINRRLLTIRPSSKDTQKILWDETWLEKQRIHVSENYKKIDSTKQMECLVSPINANLNISQLELLEIADNSQIKSIGWPIAIVFKDTLNLKPISKSDGILSEILIDSSKPKTYDYSYFKKNGQIYLSKSLFEEKDDNGNRFFVVDILICNITELLIYISRFYNRCKLLANEKIKISLKFTGLLNNSLKFLNNFLFIREQKISNENVSISVITISISDIETRLPELVNDLLSEFFVLFDFYKPDFDYLKSIVNKFVNDNNYVQH